MTPIITTTWALFAGLIVLFLPGLAWQALFWDPEQDTFERMAEAMGLSISITALLALLAYIFGWQSPLPPCVLSTNVATPKLPVGPTISRRRPLQ